MNVEETSFTLLMLASQNKQAKQKFHASAKLFKKAGSKTVLTVPVLCSVGFSFLKFLILTSSFCDEQIDDYQSSIIRSIFNTFIGTKSEAMIDTSFFQSLQYYELF
jgi:hypothetical protein